MVSRFASVTEEQILSTNKAAVPKNTKKMAKTFCLIFPTQILKHKKRYNALFTWTVEHYTSMRNEGLLRFKGLNKCFQKFGLSVRKRDGSFYNKE